jgi:hypothetical protein
VLAAAFAAQTLRKLETITAITKSVGQPMNDIRDFLEKGDKAQFTVFRDLVYSTARLSGYAPRIVIASFGITVVGSGVYAPEDSRFIALGRRFLVEFDLANLYVRYLAAFARGDGWSGALEDNFAGPSSHAWRILETAVTGSNRPEIGALVKASDLEIPIDRSCSLESEFGWVWTKAAGADGFIALDARADGSPTSYFTRMDRDGSPVGYSRKSDT